MLSRLIKQNINIYHNKNDNYTAFYSWNCLPGLLTLRALQEYECKWGVNHSDHCRGWGEKTLLPQTLLLEQPAGPQTSSGWHEESNSRQIIWDQAMKCFKSKTFRSILKQSGGVKSKDIKQRVMFSFCQRSLATAFCSGYYRLWMCPKD